MNGSGIYRAPKSGERFSCSWRGKGDSRDWLGDATRWITVTVLTFGAQKYLCMCERDSEGEEWALSTGAANLQPTTNINTITPGIFSKDVACAR